MACQQPIDVIMDSEDSNQDSKEDNENDRSSIWTLQFVHKGSFVSISDSDLNKIVSCFLTRFLICFTSDLQRDP